MTAAVIDRRPARPRTTPRAVAARRSAAVRHARRRRVFLLRRFLVAVLVAAMVLALASLWALRSEASGDGGVTATVVVGHDDTIWDIARDYVPEGVHPQAYVAQVLEHNDVDPAAVVPGTVLELPRP